MVNSNASKTTNTFDCSYIFIHKKFNDGSTIKYIHIRLTCISIRKGDKLYKYKTSSRLHNFIMKEKNVITKWTVKCTVILIPKTFKGIIKTLSFEVEKHDFPASLCVSSETHKMD